MTDILERARVKVLDGGQGLSYDELVEVLRLPDERIPELLDLAHAVRMKHCGPDVEVEGIISLKTGGCPEDCHFCSQSGQFSSPVRAVWLDVAQLVKAAKETAATGASEFCIVAAVRGPDERLMEQVREGVEAIHAEVEINVAASLGMLTPEQTDQLRADGHPSLQPQPRGRPVLLPRGRHDALLAGAVGHLQPGPRLRHGAVLRWADRHGRDPRAARRAGRPAGRARPRTRCRSTSSTRDRARRSATSR